ncbi:MAG: CBU_0585 family protein [Gammaproteobacteria bacterium]|nr:CBU_0585 family protein [Gammaproteobacteria bacterium]
MIKFFLKLFQRVDNKDKNFVSDADKFIADYDRQHPELSASQMTEIEKNRNIFNKKIDNRVRWD